MVKSETSLRQPVFSGRKDVYSYLLQRTLPGILDMSICYTLVAGSISTLVPGTRTLPEGTRTLSVWSIFLISGVRVRFLNRRHDRNSFLSLQAPQSPSSRREPQKSTRPCNNADPRPKSTWQNINARRQHQRKRGRTTAKRAEFEGGATASATAHHTAAEIPEN